MSEAAVVRAGAGGAPPIPIRSARRASLVVITPCCRPELLRFVHGSVCFSTVTRWVIVFDADHVPRQNLPVILLDHPQITLVATRAQDSRYGNAQRHFGLQIVRTLYPNDDPLIYFLDDDNLIHPTFYELFQQFMWRPGVFYTFNQRRAWLTCYGRLCRRAMVDTAMICLPLSFCPDWRPSSVYAEDFHFFRSVMRTHSGRHVYVNQVAAYYNALQPCAFTRLVGSRQHLYKIVAYLVVIITLLMAVRMILSQG